MSVFPDAQGVEVHGGQFTVATNITNTYLSSPTGIDILREASALEAIHDSSARSYSPRCFPGTREQYIEDIVGRATPSLDDTPLPIYWMKGPAGVGKSAVAQTCAEMLVEKEVLGASFFFSVSGQRKPGKFFPSIAYQLATRHPAYRDLVNHKISQDQALVNKAMRFQYQYLIYEPLRELENRGEGIEKAVQVLIDGLDECEGTGAQCEIIQIVAASVSKGVLPLRWTFFSRPESHIEAMFSKPTIAPHCHKTFLPISRGADREIELYLRNAFDNILQQYNPPAKTLWPSTKEMNIIVRGAGGSFIYATTVVRFISRPDPLSPQKRLLAIIDIILEHHSRDTDTTAPLAELDAFYLLILRRVPPEAFPSVHLFLAHMCRFGDSGAMYAANSQGMSKDEFETVFRHVSSVVCFEATSEWLNLDPSIDTSCSYTQAKGYVPIEVFEQVFRLLGGRLIFYHKSFFDFLLDSARSGSYCVRASAVLSTHLIKFHLKCDQSFCWHGSELVLAPGVSDSAASLSCPHTNEFTNSILKAWVYSWAGSEDPDSFLVPRGTRGPAADCDFRKWLYTYTTIPTPGKTYFYLLWGYGARIKYFRGGLMEYISYYNFPTSAIIKFKMMVRRREHAHIIWRYHPTLASRIKSIFRGKSREGVESALYCMGHGEKAIFWYWEINHKLRSYREFRSIDLAEGEKRFFEEDFDSWPEGPYEEDYNNRDKM